jgi:hypothetical protein
VAGTRELVISGTPFIVAYRIEKNEVRILAVLHAARESFQRVKGRPPARFAGNAQRITCQFSVAGVGVMLTSVPLQY